MFTASTALALFACATAAVAQPFDRREAGEPIHPGTNTDLCLTVQGDTFADGVPFTIERCTGAAGQSFVVNKGASSTQIRVAGQQYCLDQGNLPGGHANLWKCQDEAQGQWWTFEGSRIHSQRDQSQCLTNFDAMKLQMGVLGDACRGNDSTEDWS